MAVLAYVYINAHCLRNNDQVTTFPVDLGASAITVGKRLLTNIMLSRDSRYGVGLAPSFELSSTGALCCRSFHMKLK